MIAKKRKHIHYLLEQYIIIRDVGKDMFALSACEVFLLLKAEDLILREIAIRNRTLFKYLADDACAQARKTKKHA